MGQLLVILRGHGFAGEDLGLGVRAPLRYGSILENMSTVISRVSSRVGPVGSVLMSRLLDGAVKAMALLESSGSEGGKSDSVKESAS